MSFLQSMLGGAVGAGVLQAVESIVEKNGGVEGLVNQFQQKGFGGVAQSWVGTGENQSLSPDQLNKVLGSDAIKALATKAGLTPEELSAKISSIQGE